MFIFIITFSACAHLGLTLPSGLLIKGMFLNILLDTPAKSSWLQMRQFNCFWGCSTCKEKGSQLVTGKGKKNRWVKVHSGDTFVHVYNPIRSEFIILLPLTFSCIMIFFIQTKRKVDLCMTVHVLHVLPQEQTMPHISFQQRQINNRACNT